MTRDQIRLVLRLISHRFEQLCAHANAKHVSIVELTQYAEEAVQLSDLAAALFEDRQQQQQKEQP